MLKFGGNNGSKINILINSLDDLKNVSKKYSQTQAKAYNDLHEWALESKNSAIQDITSKLTSLYYKMDADLNQDKLNSLKDITQIFKKFKEYDVKIQKLNQATRGLEKLEKKYLGEIKRCPPSKNIRDFEVRHAKAKSDKECAELKHYNYTKEIDATKTILFKTNMKRLNAALLLQNEAERVLLVAMNSLLEKIPDVSNEEVDDISEIKYKNFEQTNYICSQAKKRLNRLSSSPNVMRVAENAYQVEEEEEAEPVVVAAATSIKRPHRKQPYNKTRTSCPPKFMLNTNEQDVPKSPMIVEEENSQIRLYPCLNKLVIQEQPPTYSDSESNYTTARRSLSTNKIVSPSAPSYSEIDTTKSSSSSFTSNQTLTDVTEQYAKTPPPPIAERRAFYKLRNN